MTTKIVTETRQLTGRIVITGPIELVEVPTIEELTAALARMRKVQNVNASIVRQEIVRRSAGDEAYDVPTRVHLSHMEYGALGDPFKAYAERRGCRLSYNWTVDKPARASLAKEFFMLDKAVDDGEEFATAVHPVHTELNAIAFAKVLLVMYGAARSQGKLAAMFRDEADLPGMERMFFFAVGAALDYAIDHADDAELPTTATDLALRDVIEPEVLTPPGLPMREPSSVDDVPVS